LSITLQAYESELVCFNGGDGAKAVLIEDSGQPGVHYTFSGGDAPATHLADA
jgi:hypothetical protein